MMETHRPGAELEPERGRSELRSLRSGHAQLDACAERVEAALAAFAEAAAPGDPEPVWQLLRELQARLLEHLATEERSRILERATRFAPRFLEQGDRLLGEHADLRAMAGALVGDEAGTAGGDWAEVQSRFVALRDALRHHEAAEDELIQRAYTEETGGSG